MVESINNVPRMKKYLFLKSTIVIHGYVNYFFGFITTKIFDIKRNNKIYNSDPSDVTGVSVSLSLKKEENEIVGIVEYRLLPTTLRSVV